MHAWCAMETDGAAQPVAARGVCATIGTRGTLGTLGTSSLSGS
ncbi:hypothetical protein LMG29739_00840 [Paraburkholderia solisilvae]|uniref:Uncharacterized protein n=1 Tax=Paraburkholderia solisilvae TaxID=624376 RepID=A0A6J5D893_9BURK|nr:hypothetical protein LMG29739_00840 [Paraburkholderia solisilvae]